MELTTQPQPAFPTATVLRTPEVASGRALPSSNHPLERCTGFRADGPEGRIGVVRRATTIDGINVFEVSTGLFLLQTLRIPVGEVIATDPARGRVTLRTSPERPRPGREELSRIVRRFLRTTGSRPISVT